MSRETRSGYRTAINEVSARVAALRSADKTKVVSFANECKEYAKDLGFKSWIELASELKAEDEAKGICWNCDHHSDDEIRECKECGRKGKSKYNVLNKKNKEDSKDMLPQFKEKDFVVINISNNNFTSRVVSVYRDEKNQNVFTCKMSNDMVFEESYLRKASAEEIQLFMQAENKVG